MDDLTLLFVSFFFLQYEETNVCVWSDMKFILLKELKINNYIYIYISA